jgi:hypothetical protein
MRLARMTGVSLATMAVVAAPASAKTITLHYFSKPVGARLTDSAGHPLNPNKPPAAGYVGDRVGLDYVGNHKHHAKHWTSSFHFRCVFRSSKRATCDGQIAIGGSMLLVKGHPNFHSNPARLTITGGTGVFQSAHGTLTMFNAGNTSNVDFTIRVRI